MSAIQKFREVTKVLNELSTAAVSARSEVEQLLVVLDGSAVTDVTAKAAPAAKGMVTAVDSDSASPDAPPPKFCPLWADCTGTGTFHLGEGFDG